MKALRYRTGFCTKTGRILRGWPHCAQSLSEIWMTRLKSRIMRLQFGSAIFSRLAEDITPELALALYGDLVEAAHKHEPEYRISDLQLVRLTRMGALGLSHRGTYYPEGRFGIYDYAEPVSMKVPLRGLRTSEMSS